MSFLGTGMVLIIRLLLSIFIIFSFLNLLRFPTQTQPRIAAENLKRDPADSKTRLQLAGDLIRQGKEREAQENLKTLLVFDPKNVYASDMLSGSLNNSDEVKKDVEKTIEVTSKRPDYKAAWIRLAYLYETLGDFEKAQSARETAESIAY